MIGARADSDPALIRFCAAVHAAFGERVERIILYGSRARGEAGPESDYDVAVFLRDLADRAQAMNRLADIGTDILFEQGAVIHAMPHPAGSYAERSPLMHEIRTDGIDL